MDEGNPVLDKIIKVLEGRDLTVLENDISIDVKPSQLIDKAFHNYFRSKQVDINSYSNIGIVINDIDRPTPSYLALQDLIFRFPDIDSRISKIHIATGSHRSMTEDEIKKVLGGASRKFIKKVYIHDGKDPEKHIDIGRTKRGTPVLIDRGLFEHDLLILINSVEPHYFAGFTGGRKTIVPGMAHYSTIEKNHSLAMEQGSKVLSLEDNPLDKDIVEATRMFMDGREHISIQLVQGPGQLLTGVFLGDIWDSFSDAVSLSREIFTIDVQGKFDVIITLAKPPMDRTLYQAQKAIENSKIALNENGVMVLVASCEEGIGNPAFWDLLTSDPDPHVILDSLKKEYRLGYHKAARLIEMTSRFKVMMVSQIHEEELIKGGIMGYGTIEDAMKKILKINDDPRILLIPDGTVTVPNVVE
jgi:nickel-dependent lactate racemase